MIIKTYKPFLDLASVATSEYFNNRENAIYPAFVDDLNYQAWSLGGKTDYFQLKALGGTEPFVWEIIGGTLPDGIKLSKDGKLFGLAKKVGNFTFRVKVTDCTKKTYEKELSMSAYKHRGHWFSDAKFGFMVQWGTYSTPALQTAEEYKQLDARTTNFNAETWAKEMFELGVKTFNFTVFAGDGVRMWPSNVISQNNFITKKNYTGDLIKACHKYGIKFIAYVGGHISWTDERDFDPTDKTCSTLQIGMIMELLDMGVDGFWFDTGATYGEPEDFIWEEVIPYIRTKNPFVSIQVNAAINCLGRLEKYPIVDVVTYEGVATSDLSLPMQVAYPNLMRKKMAIDFNEMLSDNWTYRLPVITKPAQMVIDNIIANWEMGACYTMSVVADTSGNLLCSEIKDTVYEIAKWVQENKRNYTLEPEKAGIIKFDHEVPWVGNLIRVKNSNIQLREIELAKDTKITKGNYKIINCNDYTVLDYGIFEVSDQKIFSIKPICLNKFSSYYILIQTDENLNTKLTFDHENYIVCGEVDTLFEKNDYFVDKSKSSYGNLLKVNNNMIYTESSKNDNNIIYNALRVDLMSNDDRVVSASSGTSFAENIFIEDVKIPAAAGDEQWAWTYFIELDQSYKLFNINITFGKDTYSTHWQILLSNDNKKYDVVFESKNDYIDQFKAIFQKTTAKYIKIRSLKPDGIDQVGGQMRIKQILLND